MTNERLNSQRFSALERRSVAALAGIYGLRMFGLFLILPVLAIYADQLDGATPALMGLALGVYGISQALFQIPFGIMSDRFGRKPIILLGLAIFVLGSLIAAAADTIYGVIIGRALQGAGAIAAVVLALVSDLTRENQRTKAMAFIGMSIGGAFFVAILVAPLLESVIGVPGMFLMTASLAVLAAIMVVKVIPNPSQALNLDVRAVPATMLNLLRNKQLMRLNTGIFILHFVLTAMFIAIPILLVENLAVDTQEHWKAYLPALLASIVAMVPLVILSTKKNLLMRIYLAAICLILLAQLMLMRGVDSVYSLGICLFFFFWGFNLLEAMLPSLVSRVAPAATKGSAMGVYNTFQFTGVFLGGFLGGVVYGQFGIVGVYVLCALALLAWAYLSYKAEPFNLLDSLAMRIKPNFNHDDLLAIDGVHEVVVMPEQGLAYFKVDKQTFNEETLAKFRAE